MLTLDLGERIDRLELVVELLDGIEPAPARVVDQQKVSIRNASTPLWSDTIRIGAPGRRGENQNRFCTSARPRGVVIVSMGDWGNHLV